MVEAVPNVSEGRRPDVIEALADVIRATPGVHLLDTHSDPAHHRSVFTCAGEPAPLRRAMLALVEAALARIDLRQHSGEHPRIGALDVLPFVPLDGATMADCVALAQDVAAEVAARFQIPVFLYEEAARQGFRRRLEDVRRGQFEGLATKMSQPEWQPDFGPARPHPTFGALAVGARMPLIAFNVNLASDRLDIARRIARTIRESGGGLPAVKALGVMLGNRGIAQVTMNLTDYRVTSVRAAFDAVKREAAGHGIDILESELVGLVPAAALSEADANHVRLRGFSPAQVLEERLRLR
ncbi:MAG: glutamate formimidoyltransferase [Vicinamibacterales bacterium]